LFELQQKNTVDYNQRWVSATGLLGEFTKGQRTHPQIIVEAPSEIELLCGEEEAKGRLATSVEPEIELALPARPALVDRVIPEQVGQPMKAQSVPLSSATADKISDLYQNWVGPASSIQALKGESLRPKPPRPLQLSAVMSDKIKTVEVCPRCGARVSSEYLTYHLMKSCPMLKTKML
jgi:hypothetical protein